MEEDVFGLGDFELQSGVRLPNAQLSYATHGELNAERTNAGYLAQPGFRRVRQGPRRYRKSMEVAKNSVR